jgi:3-methyladenine DNA glycosylase AlkD
MASFTQELNALLRSAGSEEEARLMCENMREQFDFYGVRTPILREITGPLFEAQKPKDAEELERRVRDMWQQSYRELQYAACDYLFMYRHLLDNHHIQLLQDLITSHAWYDTADPLAKKSLGSLVMRFPMLKKTMQKWLHHPNIWVRRSAMIHQANCGKKTDWELLKAFALDLREDADSFVLKGVGVALREYSRVAPAEVRAFTFANDFSPATRQEALRFL